MTSRRPEGRRLSKLIWSREYEAFRKKLVAARTAAGLTQREAAALLGKEQGFVAKAETGERRVDVVELEEFAKVYRKPMAFFFKSR